MNASKEMDKNEEDKPMATTSIQPVDGNLTRQVTLQCDDREAPAATAKRSLGTHTRVSRL